MKKAVGVGVPLVLVLAVAAYLAVTWYGKDEAPKHRVFRRSVQPHEMPDFLHEAMKAAAAEDAPAYVQDKRFLGAIAKMAGNLLSQPKPVQPAQLKQTIDELGSVRNMAPDIMSDSVKQEQEVTGEVEKEVAEKTIENLFGGSANVGSQGKTNQKRGGPATGTGEMKAEIDFIEQKGMVQEDMFAPPGMKMKVDVEKSPKKQNEKDDMSPPKAFSYPMGMGGTMMNGCFGTGYVRGDPCYKAKRPLPPCQNLMEGCRYIGVGFDGRGEYSSVSRRKTVIQRKCSLQKKYHKEELPDNMNVQGVYDTKTTSLVFESRQSYRQSLQQKAGVSASGWGFQASVNAAWGGSQKSEKQMFMSLIEADVISPSSIVSQEKCLPVAEDFIIRYGTHFIKSAKFGGAFRLFKTQEAAKSESLTSFSVSAQASYNGMFSAGGHYGRNEESGAASSEQSASTRVMIEGGDQKVGAIVADFYTTGFKDTFLEWLKSIPSYPKPIEMFMGTLSELLNLNFKMLFPFDMSDAADGCFSKNYCEDSSITEFQLSMDKKRLALERAIAVYMEEGPVPTTDFSLPGGKPGCQTDLLTVKGGDSGVSHPSWLDLINGETYKIFFDLKMDINYKIKRSTEAFVVYSEGRWNCHHPDETLHVYNSYSNGGSGNTANKKVSCFGFVMTYDERTGKLFVTVDDRIASSKVIRSVSYKLVNKVVARVEFVSPLEHSQSSSSALASILEAPCEVKWSNSYQIKPSEEGGRCLYFVAASDGDIFVVFAAIPRDKTTWYHLQISFQGVALYKGMKLVKYEGAKSARSLGDRKLFQPYFICIEEDGEGRKTYITYGIGSDSSETGLIYMVYSDSGDPLGIQFYSFGSGEKDIEIMDARVIEGGNAGQMECTGGTIMVDGRCVEDCHPECNGCDPGSPGSRLDTECLECKHYSVEKGDGTTQCVAACPAGMEPGSDGLTCICSVLKITRNDGTTECVSACPDTHEVADDGVTCQLKIYKWRTDFKCGPSFTTPKANPGQCNPSSSAPCCSPGGWCGSTAAHCTCSGCIDYRSKWRSDSRCGSSYPAPGANPGQCNPNSGTPCCSSGGWCGSSSAHCTCSGCVDYRPAKWRSDLRCGSSYPAPGANPGQCNPNSGTPCCSSGGWCGSSSAHCTCSGCVDYRKLVIQRSKTFLIKENYIQGADLVRRNGDLTLDADPASQHQERTPDSATLIQARRAVPPARGAGAPQLTVTVAAVLTTFFNMKKAVGVGVPLVLVLAVAAYLAVTWDGKDEEPEHRVFRRSIQPHGSETCWYKEDIPISTLEKPLTRRSLHYNYSNGNIVALMVSDKDN
uniref:MACPF domain-containing protein n=1 Tax=Branchiostoma floridae TaxID=7739 RepID=C3ZX09_BRAFL|eukprot:XP_002586913.1 hypothetical protein BRAFLDRAFT_105135 [Branchiostoma floridae]